MNPEGRIVFASNIGRREKHSGTSIEVRHAYATDMDSLARVFCEAGVSHLRKYAIAP